MDVHHLRLMVLLHELVREKGYKGAARVLGIDSRTVAACTAEGRMSWRVWEALERGYSRGLARLRPGSGSSMKPWSSA